MSEQEIIGNELREFVGSCAANLFLCLFSWFLTFPFNNYL